MIRFDCHAHVYEDVNSIADARYTPGRAAPLAAWLKHQKDEGLAGGVIIQVSFLGTDNRQMLSALAQLDRLRFAGIAVVNPEINDAELQSLAAQNVRGIRWNLVAGAPLPDPADPLIRRLACGLASHGMHLEIQLESPRLAQYLPEVMKLKLPVVVDHIGLPCCEDAQTEPWLNALSRLSRREQIYVKLSAPYRGVEDPRGHIDRLLGLLNDKHVLWGSDWPHTRHEATATYSGLRSALSHDDVDDAEAALALYGLR